MSETTYSLNDKFNGPVEEAYKVLRTNIQFCGIGQNRTITVTSSGPGEGKTTTALNLAISMAKSGIKVILVDGDLRKPMAVKPLGSKNTKGLSNIISGYANLADAVNTTNLENLFFLACGPKPPNPAELIGSIRFSELLKKLQEEYDMVIIDTPPLGSVIDAAIVASQTDGTLLVIQSKSVNYTSVQRVKEQLEKTNARILGVVLNKMKKRDFRGYYSYYNYYGSGKNSARRSSWLSRIFRKREKVAI